LPMFSTEKKREVGGQVSEHRGMPKRQKIKVKTFPRERLAGQKGLLRKGSWEKKVQRRGGKGGKSEGDKGEKKRGGGGKSSSRGKTSEIVKKTGRQEKKKETKTVGKGRKEREKGNENPNLWFFVGNEGGGKGEVSTLAKRAVRFRTAKGETGSAAGKSKSKKGDALFHFGEIRSEKGREQNGTNSRKMVGWKKPKRHPGSQGGEGKKKKLWQHFKG